VAQWLVVLPGWGVGCRAAGRGYGRRGRRRGCGGGCCRREARYRPRPGAGGSWGTGAGGTPGASTPRRVMPWKRPSSRTRQDGRTRHGGVGDQPVDHRRDRRGTRQPLMTAAEPMVAQQLLHGGLGRSRTRHRPAGRRSGVPHRPARSPPPSGYSEVRAPGTVRALEGAEDRSRTRGRPGQVNLRR
jgi:hypothetical protein